MWTQVVREPIVREAETQVGDSELRLDSGVRGVWQSQAEALLLDFTDIDTDAPPYSYRIHQNQFLNRELRTKEDVQTSSGRS